MENMPLEETLLHSKALHYKYCIGNNNNQQTHYGVPREGRCRGWQEKMLSSSCSNLSLFTGVVIQKVFVLSFTLGAGYLLI